MLGKSRKKSPYHSPSESRTDLIYGPNYTVDLKHALWSLQSASSLPPFPKSEWKHVLSGMAVNIDIVFSSLFSTLTDDKITTTIGDFDLSVRGSKPSKTIQTHGDWTIAWNATSAAILCAFPHHTLDLQTVHQIPPSVFWCLSFSHTKVINLDKAICCYTGEVKHIELSEFGRFRHLEAHHLQDDGAGNCTGSSKEKEIAKPDRRSTEACHQWNSGFVAGVPQNVNTAICVPTAMGSTHGWNV